jgi:serine/threonine protein kinase
MEPGYRIEHYVVIEKIGQGGQAAVWSAFDERLKRTVAIKTIGLSAFMGEDASGTAPAGATNLTNPDRFREEAEIIAALEHPNILPIYAFGQDGDYLYIVMRYMAAGSLKDMLKREVPDLETVIALMEPLAGALDLAHQNQIIHRDLKTANVLLDAHRHPYLADFGLSMTIGDKNSVAGVGTLAYMSPEQMMGEPLDHRSDLYAFGILLFEMITGKLPVIDGQPWNLQQMMNNTPLPITAEIPPAVGYILLKATAKEAADRYNNATEIINELRGTVTPKTEVIKLPPEPVITDPALLALKEATTLFRHALERWSDGAGRFRLDAGDYRYVDSFYSASNVWGIEVDAMAQRFLLRAALEHGSNLDHWWGLVESTDDRRGIALQTLTSDSSTGRLRALQRLSDIPDSDPPAIPIRVANVIGAEPEATVRIAGIRLLEQRAAKSTPWRYAAYSEVVDGTLAEIAAHDPDHAVAEAAARACARLRSSMAVLQLSRWAAAGDSRALHALTHVRDEVDAFPQGVPIAVRQRVFVALSQRQLFANPLGLVWRYVGAVLGFWLGIGTFIFINYNDPTGVLVAQRIGTALAAGALYSLFLGLGVLAATEPAARLHAWTRPGRIVLSWLVGAVFAAFTFVLFHRFFYFFLVPDWIWLLGVGAVFVAGFAIASGLTERPWIRSAAGTASALIAIYLSWQVGLQIGRDPLLFLFEGQDDQSLLLSLWVAASLGLLTFLPEWLSALRRLNQRLARYADA